MGLSYDQLFPGRFIKAGEFKGRDVTMTIKDVFLDELEKEDSTTHTTPIVSFEETKRQWVLIKTNAQCLMAMWGPDTEDWIGKRVTLYPERDGSGLSDSGLCIRVKGSPDIAGKVTAQIKLPRRRPQTRTLVPTARGSDAPLDDEPNAATPPAESSPADEEPIHTDANGEVTEPDPQADAEDGFPWGDGEPEEPAPAAKASPRQLSKIALLMKERDCDVEGVRNWMRNQWGISSRAQLDKDQAGLLIEYLNNLPGRLSLDAERGAA